MLRYVIGVCLGMTTIACDTGSDDGDDEVLREELFAADFDLADAVDDVDALVENDELIAAEAMLGVDGLEYEVVAVEGDELVIRVVEARRRRVVDEIRERADDRSRGDADRLRLHRQRLADRLRDARDRRPDHRSRRARLAGEELEIEWLDRDGRRENERERLDGR